ncbi:glycosyltransferase family 4 protein [Carboxydochorda subterranea]|uniref:Glycosyltransferase family 4 protein n=1 Tax=Carboxydichorda subterranea TaxID=3109565 RepID=A0ABZ1C1H8_9FIRM|nr:glycosyltransferase family 4 protein [Limnochorda sp. L945t]WRP18827.1 glycosyltransferase family 4 protein [Limnochorda sp. L945t]
MKVMAVYLGRRGGATVYSLEIVRALARLCDVTAVISSRVTNLAEWEQAEVPFIPIDTYSNAIEFGLRTLTLVPLKRFRELMRAVRPDVVYFPMLTPWSLFASFVTKDIPVVSTVHDPRQRYGERNAALRLMQQAVIRRSARVILVSRSFVREIERYGKPKDCIDVIPHGHFMYYRRYSLHSEQPATSRTLLFFGRITPYKGVDILLRAFKNVKQEVPDARLLIVGSGYSSSLHKIAKQVDGVEIVNRWVSDEEVAPFFQEASVVVLPYRDASQSGVIPIAYAFGRPVVATKVGALPEQVVHGKTGLLVEPLDAEALARACVYLLLRPEVAAEMGARGLRMAAREGDWGRIGEQVLESLRKAAECNTLGHGRPQ